VTTVSANVSLAESISATTPTDVINALYILHAMILAIPGLLCGP
jgi:hypothetical protein